ncbi:MULTISPECIES: DNA methyltransferase [unclassified Coleofasciculus]|uniref:DNA methyltransferase n=1 Tax=unclassified Coleofasciculus TaxID=2692782 RepID=UPI00187F852E|nr:MULTISPECIES: DNA methyltransferase [unclassified Coleofasciculus]MBE9125792.1 DNA adenine methylase [Coleofasciculus sp. LEGE 07081]MBE9148465.1 DNA adenine methylase [Coleofasciculus sp. LEGE 07092]
MLSTVKQRADYTFKFNRTLGRHGWLRLTPAYGVKLVEKILASVERDAIILDPFSGTATTGLVAAEHGNQAVTFDINPFLVWLGNAKCRNYCEDCLINIRKGVQQALKEYKSLVEQDNWIPQIFNIERWWSSYTLKCIAALRTALVNQFGETEENKLYDLVWIAFCRLIIETSSASFNHVSMSFNETTTHFEIEYIEELFVTILGFVLSSAEQHIQGKAKVIKTDSRNIVELNNIKVDQVITSPPYPNRMSYIRELRPYMYWTKFLDEAKEAGEIDWMAIGGTWGIATSRLTSWQVQEWKLPEDIFLVAERIQTSKGKNAALLAVYVLKYFHDMHLHLSSLRHILKNGAELHYIVGNSTFFGNMVDTSALISKSMQMLGYSEIHSKIIRKRNCKKALYEYCVSAAWSDS